MGKKYRAAGNYLLSRDTCYISRGERTAVTRRPDLFRRRISWNFMKNENVLEEYRFLAYKYLGV